MGLHHLHSVLHTENFPQLSSHRAQSSQADIPRQQR